MTTFDGRESSTESSRPVELYEVVLGGTTYRWNSSQDTITVGGNDFTPEPISRGGISQSIEQKSNTLTVSVDVDNEFATQYVTVPPGQRATINIYRYQRDEVPAFNTQILAFKGLVQSVSYPQDGYSAAINARSIETALNRNLPRFTFMSMCNHIWGDPGCGVTVANFAHTGEVTAVSGNTITVDGAGASGHDFTGGYVVTTTGANDFRLVISQSGDVLTLLLPFSANVDGLNVQAFAGCDHIIDSDCALVFDRVAEFGGFAFVPDVDVFRSGLPTS